MNTFSSAFVSRTVNASVSGGCGRTDAPSALSPGQDDHATAHENRCVTQPANLTSARQRSKYTKRANKLNPNASGGDVPQTAPKDITQLLINWANGDQGALETLMPLVYEELRRLALNYMRRERPVHTLATTGLVHEAYLRLVDQKVNWQSRAHFFGIAAQLMRRILVDHVT
jgi:hypothetical protein